MISELCGSFCLFFFYIIEKMDYYESVLKICFGELYMPISVLGNSSKSPEKEMIQVYSFAKVI